MATDKRLLKEYCAELNVTVSDDAAEILSAFSEKVLVANAKFNLTSITNEPDFTEKHLIDSAVGADLPPYGSSLCDIGAGAGFPSVPLAVIRPDITVTAIDSTAKKTSFIKQSASELNITNVSVFTGRAEECAELREKFDCACARAVAPLAALLELAFPLLKTGGLFFAYKTDKSELPSACGALKALNGEFISDKSFSLPSGGSRCILIFRKLKPTPVKYPRPYASIKKNPL